MDFSASQRRRFLVVLLCVALFLAGTLAAVVHAQTLGGTEATATFTNTNVVTYTIPEPGTTTLTATETQQITTTVTETITAPSSTTAPTTTTAPPPSERLVVFGSSTPPNAKHGTTTKEAEAEFLEAKMGRKLGATRHYVRAPGDWTGDGAGESANHGRIPVVTFTSGGASWPQVTNGSIDNYVAAQTKALVARGGTWKKAYIAFENEPEAEVPGKGTATDYVAAYNHLIAVMDSAGFPSTAHHTTAFMEFSWQAGSGRDPDKWVSGLHIDTLGVHGYSTRVSTCGDGPRSFIQTFDGPHATAAKYGLRMGIFEAGYATKVGADPVAKAAFFRSIPTALAQLPRVDIYTYWNQNGTKCGYANSYYLDSASQAFSGWIDAGKTAILGG